MNFSTLANSQGRSLGATRRLAAIFSIAALCCPGLLALALPPLPEDFVNDQTQWLFVFDLAQATPSAVDATGRGVIDQDPSLAKAYDAVRGDYDAFSGAGARVVVLAAPASSDRDINAFLPAAGVFIDTDMSDEPALMELMKKHAEGLVADPVIERHGDWLLLWQSQRRALTNPPKGGAKLELPGFDPKRCDRVRAAYNALDGRAAGLVFIPTEEMHKQAKEDAAALPPEVLQSPAGIRLLFMSALESHAWIDLGHNPSVTGVIELPEATQATQLKNLIDSMLGQFNAQLKQEQEDAGGEVELPPDVSLAFKVLRALSCIQQGSTITVSIGQADLRPILDLAGPMLVEKREQARQVQAMSQARQLSVSLIMYLNDHHNQWPDSLDDLVSAGMMTREQLDNLLVNPMTGEANAFKYVKPDQPFDKMDDPSSVPIIYEVRNGAIYKQGFICYADSHVEAGHE